jgi:MSHA pilin protein MshC
MNYISGSAGDTCIDAIDYTSPDYLHTSAIEMQNADVQLEVAGDDGSAYEHIDFDNLGRPLTGSGNNCSTTCKIALQGQQTLYVCVESQGYIHACD